MTKQIGRNPDVSRAIRDPRHRPTRSVWTSSAPSPPPRRPAASATSGTSCRFPATAHPRGRAAPATTGRSSPTTKPGEAGAAARARRPRAQTCSLRVARPGDRFYRGHEGGMPAQTTSWPSPTGSTRSPASVRRRHDLPGNALRPGVRHRRATPNLATLTDAKAALERAGRTGVEVNAPGTTSTAILLDAGRGRCDPGRAGSRAHGHHAAGTPWPTSSRSPPSPTSAEVSHLWDGEAFVFGGGLYVDPVLGRTPTQRSCLPRGHGLADAIRVDVEMPAPEAIDYYAIQSPTTGRIAPGDTVLFGFRPQVFVTRASPSPSPTSSGVPPPVCADGWSAPSALPAAAGLHGTSPLRTNRPADVPARLKRHQQAASAASSPIERFDLRGRGRRDRRAGRRQRRRQVHAGQDHLRPLPADRGRDLDRRRAP